MLRNLSQCFTFQIGLFLSSLLLIFLITIITVQYTTNTETQKGIKYTNIFKCSDSCNHLLTKKTIWYKIKPKQDLFPESRTIRNEHHY